MPIARRPSRRDERDENGHLKVFDKYELDAELIGPDAGSRLLELRKRHIAMRDELLSVQKIVADRDMARFVKEEARHHLQMYRAACLLIPYVVSDYPGDCNVVDTWEWPPELFPALERVSASAILA